KTFSMQLSSSSSYLLPTQSAVLTSGSEVNITKLSGPITSMDTHLLLLSFHQINERTPMNVIHFTI
ncbi:hypothetical protein L0F63_002395, partial [Massospora cicadina]